MSISQNEILKTMTSSGTSDQRPSKIYLDSRNAQVQTKVLAKIVSEFIGPKRLPLLVIDQADVLKDRHSFSARGAGILGFSVFGRDMTYALNSDMTLNHEAIGSFLERHRNQDILLFGFTFMVWKHFLHAIQKNNLSIDLSRGILIHGGGWKKLIDESVDSETFKTRLREATGLHRIHNYYGLVEQTGSIFMECEEGYLHSSIFSDVLIRRKDLSVAPFRESGMIEVISLLPSSYPGHLLLTEDHGEIFGEDNCLCGRKGTYFKVYGRIQKAEMRGCSDTFSS